MALETYIPLKEAARRYGISAKILTHNVEAGIIRAVRVNGGIAVAEEDVQVLSKRDELWERVKHLDGVPIGVEEARRKYHLGAASLNRWIRSKIVRVIETPSGRGRGKKKLLNEADVAYAELVAKERGRKRGKRIFTDEYLPPHYHRDYALIS